MIKSKNYAFLACTVGRVPYIWVRHLKSGVSWHYTGTFRTGRCKFSDTRTTDSNFGGKNKQLSLESLRSELKRLTDLDTTDQIMSAMDADTLERDEYELAVQEFLDEPISAPVNS